MSINIYCITNIPIDSNTYIVTDNRSCIIIDPGGESPRLIEDYIETNHLNPEYIILTHEHYDHIWTCNFLMEKYPIKVICSRRCGQKIANSKKNFSFYFCDNPFEVNGDIYEIESMDMEIKWQGHNIKIIDAKAHTDAGIMILINNYLFTGDTIIKNLPTITKVSGGSDKELKESYLLLKSFVGRNYVVYPGHGELFNLDNYNLEIMLKKS